MLFSARTIYRLTKSLLGFRTPSYVQFYITSRCNLRCQQCNIIYANSDVKECSPDDVKRIADNLAAIGVPIVLLTGGEPFMRKDLPEIISAFESRGVHVRMQTNGFASEAQIEAVADAGGNDISISLDTLDPALQDKINGNKQGSWEKALKAMALFSQYLPKESSFASLGCVLQPDNINHIEPLIRFATSAGWFTSLVPVHVTDRSHPMNFRSFDKTLSFKEKDIPEAESLLRRIHSLKKEGALLYDSEPYLDDVLRFIKREPILWRELHKGICDSPGLYFVILPNGAFAPCYDFRASREILVQSPSFPSIYRSREFFRNTMEITSRCAGCMFGSFPEITIAIRHHHTTWQRFKLFLAAPPAKPWPLKYEDLLEKASFFRNSAAMNLNK